MSIRKAASAVGSSSSTFKSALAGPSTSTARRYLATPSDTVFPPFVLPEIHLGQTHLARYHEHYDSALAPDLMYLSYDHRISKAPERPPPEPKPMSPYEANRPRFSREIPTKNTPLTVDKIPRLDKITLHTYNKRAVQSKHYLLPTIMALRAISGESMNGGGRSSSTGVQVLRARNGAAQWKLREGMPVAASVEMKGEAMYDFMQSLVDFVLPRLREFSGFPIVQSPSPRYKNASSGTVQMGFEPIAMGLFPQIEANIDQYPQMYGFNVHFHTNAKGPNAQQMARTLLSGFRMPFYRQ